MADPLSVAASIISLIGAVNVTIKGLERLATLRDAPALIRQLACEVWADWQPVCVPCRSMLTPP